MSIRNVAGMGRFSSDRTIRGYASRIWEARPLPMAPPAGEGT
jgi:glucan phosphorylase